MIYEITLNKSPNQLINFTIPGEKDTVNLYDLQLKEYTPDLLIASLKINGVQIFTSRRISNLMPFIYSNEYGGNFYFKDLYGNSDPTYKDFNTRYKLLFNTNYKV